MPITPLPTAPSRQYPATFSDRADAHVAALELFTTEANTLEETVNTAEANALSSKNSAANSAASAATSANFKGQWVAGTYTIPSTASNNGINWALLVASTTGEPGISSDWGRVTLATPSKNLIINPEGLVNQEGYVDGAATTEAQWLFDMWAVDRATAGNALLVTRTGKGFLLDNNVSVAVQSWFRTQNDNIDAVADGETLTISGNVTDVSSNIVIQGYGADVTISSTGAFSHTFVKDSSDSGLTDTPYIKFQLAANTTATIEELKLEEGGVSTLYSTPRKTDNELACFRYLIVYDELDIVGDVGLATSTTTVIIPIPLLVPLSKTPVLRYDTDMEMRCRGNSETISSASTFLPSVESLLNNKVHISIPIGSAIGGYFTQYNHYTMEYAYTGGVGHLGLFKIDARPTL